MSKFKFEKQFRAENPQTVGETDKHFDLDNYKDWLESKLEWIDVNETIPVSGADLLVVKWTNKKGEAKYGFATFIDFHSIGLSKSHSLDFIIQGSCKQNVTHWRSFL